MLLCHSMHHSATIAMSIAEASSAFVTPSPLKSAMRGFSSLVQTSGVSFSLTAFHREPNSLARGQTVGFGEPDITRRKLVMIDRSGVLSAPVGAVKAELRAGKFRPCADIHRQTNIMQYCYYYS